MQWDFSILQLQISFSTFITHAMGFFDFAAANILFHIHYTCNGIFRFCSCKYPFHIHYTDVVLLIISQCALECFECGAVKMPFPIVHTDAIYLSISEHVTFYFAAVILIHAFPYFYILDTDVVSFTKSEHLIFLM